MVNNAIAHMLLNQKHSGAYTISVKFNEPAHKITSELYGIMWYSVEHCGNHAFMQLLLKQVLYKILHLGFQISQNNLYNIM